jgi:NADH-quinone oxidoreductase subunit N
MIDEAVASIDLNLIAPELTLLITACVILLFSFARSMQRGASAVAFVGLVVALVLSANQWGHQASGFFGMVTCDNYGAMFKIIFCVASLLALLLAVRYFSQRGLNRPEFYALLLISTLGMMVMANTSDLVVMFLGLEIMSVPLYVMAGFSRRSLESNEAGIKYFLMGAFASGFLLMGIAFVFGASGTTDLRRLVTDFNFIVSNFDLFLSLGGALVLIGFAFKVAAVPFHAWVPDVYQGAPTPVTAFFSVGPKAAGFAVLFRIFTFGFGDLEVLTNLFWILAVLTMTVGNVLALRQDNVKRMLAYSSIAHAGYVLVALAVGTQGAVSAAIFYLVAYMMFNTGAFAVLTMLETRAGSKSNFSELAGLAKANPYLSAVLALFMFALSGFPPTVGFFGKFYLFASAVNNGFIWLAIIGVMNSFLSVYYYLRVVKVSYFDSPEGAWTPVPFSTAIIVVLFVTAIGTLGLGFFPGELLKLSQTSLIAFL